MDIHYCSWYRCRLYFNVSILNLWLVIMSITGYLTNEFALKPRFRSSILHGYLNDFLAIVLLLAIANLLMISFAPFPIWKKSWIFAAVATFAALYWEYVTPLYANSVTDNLDFVAYALGAIFFVLISRSARRQVNQVG